MRKIKEVVVVEGRYDKNTLSQVVDAVILETSGFGIFNDGLIIQARKIKALCRRGFYFNLALFLPGLSVCLCSALLR